jgi:hypothetical protein
MAFFTATHEGCTLRATRAGPTIADVALGTFSFYVDWKDGIEQVAETAHTIGHVHLQFDGTMLVVRIEDRQCMDAVFSVPWTRALYDDLLAALEAKCNECRNYRVRGFVRTYDGWTLDASTGYDPAYGYTMTITFSTKNTELELSAKCKLQESAGTLRIGGAHEPFSEFSIYTFRYTGRSMQIYEEAHGGTGLSFDWPDTLVFEFFAWLKSSCRIEVS